MQEYEELMGELIELGLTANPVCPFASCIIDPCGQILVTAANAGHISPLYSAEGLALHQLALNYRCRPDQKLVLLTNAEPDHASMGALIWARCYGINISKIVFGLSRPKLKEIWTCDYSYRAEEVLARLGSDSESKPELIGPILEEDCIEAFEDGKSIHDQGESPVLSRDLDEFWMAGDWMLEMEE